MEKVRVTLVRSTIGALKVQKATVAALGLKKIRSFRIHQENPCILGMIKKVNYLLKVEKI